MKNIFLIKDYIQNDLSFQEKNVALLYFFILKKYKSCYNEKNRENQEKKMQNILGKRLKYLRQENRLTLSELSKRSGLSVGFLSKIEKGTSTITVDKLNDIANCLNINIGYFFEETENIHKDGIAVRSYERRMQHYDQKNRHNFALANHLNDKEFLPQYVELLPGYNEELESFAHEGEEFIFVLEGVLTLHVLKERLELYPGDSAYFKSDDEHVWANNTAKTVRLIVVKTPNVYRMED